MKCIKSVLLLAILSLILLCITACGQQVKENDIYGTYYFTRLVDGVHDQHNKPIQIVYVLTFKKAPDGKNYYFEQDMYHNGQKGHMVQTLPGYWDNTKHALTIGTMVPFEYIPKDNTIHWGGDILYRLTEQNKPELEKAIAYSNSQKF